MVQLMREVYSNVKVTAHTDKSLTSFLECKLGVKQAYMLSPRQELEEMLKKSKFRGISMGNAIKFFFVLELQKKINTLEKFCDKWVWK